MNNNKNDTNNYILNDKYNLLINQGMNKNRRNNINNRQKSNTKSSIYKDIHSVDIIKDDNDNFPPIDLSESHNVQIDDPKKKIINISSTIVKKEGKIDLTNNLNSHKYDYPNSNVNKRSQPSIMSNPNKKSKPTVSNFKFSKSKLNEKKNNNEGNFSQSLDTLIRFT